MTASTRRNGTIAVLCAAAAAAVMALPVLAATPKLAGTVGPGFTIRMAKPTKPGKYTLVVSDRSDEHNFHLRGPGVNVKTSVVKTGTKTFAITLARGTYRFVCDPHRTEMRGSFTIK